VTFPRGNLAPEGSVIKSTAIDPSVVDADGVYRKTGPARVFVREKDAIAAIKNPGAAGIKAGDVLVLICPWADRRGDGGDLPDHRRAEHLSFGKHVAVITDARFSGVSTGACIGHVGPRRSPAGPSAGCGTATRSRVVVDRNRLEGSIDLVGRAAASSQRTRARALLAARSAASRSLGRPRHRGRHAAVGRVCSRRAAGRGRLRLRRGRDRRRAPPLSGADRSGHL